MNEIPSYKPESQIKLTSMQPQMLGKLSDSKIGTTFKAAIGHLWSIGIPREDKRKLDSIVDECLKKHVDYGTLDEAKKSIKIAVRLQVYGKYHDFKASIDQATKEGIKLPKDYDDIDRNSTFNKTNILKNTNTIIQTILSIKDSNKINDLDFKIGRHSRLEKKAVQKFNKLINLSNHPRLQQLIKENAENSLDFLSLGQDDKTLLSTLKNKYRKTKKTIDGKSAGYDVINQSRSDKSSFSSIESIVNKIDIEYIQRNKLNVETSFYLITNLLSLIEENPKITLKEIISKDSELKEFMESKSISEEGNLESLSKALFKQAGEGIKDSKYSFDTAANPKAVNGLFQESIDIRDAEKWKEVKDKHLKDLQNIYNNILK